MHGINAQKSVFSRALDLLMVGAVVCLSGCVLDDLPARGDKCPDGDQIFEGEDAPYVVLNRIKCYDGYFISDTIPVKKIDDGKSACCEEKEGIWTCHFNKYDSCKNDFLTDFQKDVLTCYYYQKASFFGDKRTDLLSFSAYCENEENCKENTEKINECPEDYSCAYTDKNEEYIFICNRTCLPPRLYCPDESTKDMTLVCTDPDEDDLHCGASGSCTNSGKDEDSKGVVCEGGKICRNGKCDCPDGYRFCNGSCKNIKVDSKNCGDCENACGNDEVCIDGKCNDSNCDGENKCSKADCTNVLDKCGGGCVNCSLIPHVVNARCGIEDDGENEGECIISQCDEGYHISKNFRICEVNTMSSCAKPDSNEALNCEKAYFHGTGWYCSLEGECMARGCLSDGDEKYSLDNNGKCVSACSLCDGNKHEVCSKDKKGCRCDKGWAFCPVGERGICVNILNDDEHCGSCENSCLDDERCDNSQCVKK